MMDQGRLVVQSNQKPRGEETYLTAMVRMSSQ
jgi:hypothetical protein